VVYNRAFIILLMGGYKVGYTSLCDRRKGCSHAEPGEGFDIPAKQGVVEVVRAVFLLPE
jgi:hypothetical protein